MISALQNWVGRDETNIFSHYLSKVQCPRYYWRHFGFLARAYYVYLL